jgi:hypothetical protein
MARMLFMVLENIAPEKAWNARATMDSTHLNALRNEYS